MIGKLCKTLHFLSLDVVLGAGFCQYMFWKLPNGQGKVNLPTIISLSMAIWLIYLLDRLIDQPQKPTVRHEFHSKNKLSIYTLCLMLGFIAWLNCYFLPEIVLKNGLILCFLTGFYLLVVVYWLKLYWLKEISTALIYTAGIVLPPYWISNEIYVFLTFNFFLITLQNLLLFSWFEGNEKQNIVRFLGYKKTKAPIFFISAWIAFGLFYQSGYAFKIAFIEFLMSILLVLILYFHQHTSRKERYRYLADGVFLLGGLLYFLR